ncbi:MAG: hypothetical protein ACRDWD_03705 [Acidimicrobiia bacterium]
MTDSGALLALLVIGAMALGLLTRRRVTGVPLRMSLTRPGATRIHRQLHDDLRRARRAVARAQREGFPVQIPAEVLADTEHRARDLDARLLASCRLPFLARQREALVLRAEAADVRRVAARVEQLANELVTPPAPRPAPRELHRRLDALDAARRDAHGVSHRWGGTGPAAT